MERVWTPWRMEYILDTEKSGCVFCHRQSAENDETAYIIDRFETGFTVLNIYPYSVGHLMVCPFRHVGSWGELTADERRDIFRAAQEAHRLLARVYRPRTIHVGINVGRPGGAGIVGHLHMHLVPWPSAGRIDEPDRDDVEFLPESLDETYRRLQAAQTDA